MSIPNRGIVSLFVRSLTHCNEELSKIHDMPENSLNDLKIKKIALDKINNEIKELYDETKKHEVTSLTDKEIESLKEIDSTIKSIQKQIGKENHHIDQRESKYIETEDVGLPSAAGEEAGRLPRFAKAFRVINPGKYAQTDPNEFDQMLYHIHNARMPSKAEISYALLQYKTNKLKEISQTAQQMHDPEAARVYFNDNMSKLGFEPISIELTDENGVKENLIVWNDPDAKFIVHTTPFWLINEKIAPKMLTEEGKADPNFLLNNNQKLCASPIKTGDGHIFQEDSRGGIILSVPTESILDTYATDRLSPTGFVKSKDEVEQMSAVDRKKYEEDLIRVSQFVDFIKAHKACLSYINHISNALLATILAINPNLTENQREMIEKVLAGLTDLEKKVLLNPKSSTFEREAILIKHLNSIIDIYEKFGKEYLEKTEFGSTIFSVGKGEEFSISDELQLMKSSMSAFYDEFEKWNEVNLHPEASKWEQAIRENNEVFAKRLMPSKLYGPDALDIFKDSQTFVELNIKTKGVDLVGFALDQAHLERTSEGLKLNLLSANETIQKEVAPLQTRLAELQDHLVTIKEKEPENLEEINSIQVEIKAIKNQLKPYTYVVNRRDLTTLIQFSNLNHVPVILVGTER